MHADTPNRRRHSASTAASWSQSEVINCCLTTFSATWRDEIALCQQRDVIIYITAPDVARLYVLNWTNSFILPLTTARTHTSISMWKTALFFFPHAFFVCLTSLRVIWSETIIQGCKINTLHIIAQKQQIPFHVTSWHIRVCTNVQMRRQKCMPVKPTRLPFFPPLLRQYSGSLLCLELSQIIARG